MSGAWDEGGDDGVGERGRGLARADPVPFHLALGRPAVGRERPLPEVAERVPVGVPERNAAEREQLPLGELPRLVEEEQVHAAIVPYRRPRGVRFPTRTATPNASHP